LGKRPLLVSESRHDFDAVHNGFEKELVPQGIVEQTYVTDSACIAWEIKRLRTCRVALVNSAFRDALEEVLEQALGPLHRYHSRRKEELKDKEMVRGAETSDEQENVEFIKGEGESEAEVGKGKDERDAETDESDDETGEEEDPDDYNYDPEYLATGWFTDPEVKGIVSKILGQFQLDESTIEAEAIKRCLPDLEVLDKMLCTLEARLNKTLRCIAEYRESLARQLRESADRIIEGRKNILALEDPVAKLNWVLTGGE
jgi:hypothetical protein